MTNGVKLATPLVATYAYDNAGNLISVTEPNGVKTTYTYDELDRLTSVKVTSAGGQLISSDTYTLDDLGRRVADDGFQLQTDGTLDEVRVSWAYDALGRLVEEASTDITGERPELSYTTTYSYDLVGNILTEATTTSAGTVTTTFTYNGDDELVEAESSSGSATDYTYDANGSLIETMVDGQIAATYSYDLQNRMDGSTTYSTNSAGQLIAVSGTYTYDPAGNLVKQVTTVAVEGVMQSSNEEQFLNDPKNGTGTTQPIEVQNSQGTPLVTYIWGAQALFQVGSDGQSQYLIQDGLGSTRLLTDATGQITVRYDYTAYGDAVGFDPSTAATSLLYAGERYDATTGQYDLGSRTYNPETMRFNERDSFSGDTGTPQSLNKYAYVQGDPVNETDPTGFGIDAALLGIVVHVKIGRDFITNAYPFTDQVNGPYNKGEGAANRTLRKIFLLNPTQQLAFDTLRGFTEGYDDEAAPVTVVLPDPILLGVEVATYELSEAAEKVLNSRPDLIAFISQPPQIWEIKPQNEKSQGENQLQGYINAANAIVLSTTVVEFFQSGNLPSFSLFTKGTNNPPKRGYQAPDVFFAGIDLNIDQSTPGLILYNNSEALQVDEKILEGTTAFSAIYLAVGLGCSLFAPYVEPLLIAIQTEVDLAIDAAYIGLTTAVVSATAALAPVLQFGSQLKLSTAYLNAAAGPGTVLPVSTAATPDLASNDPNLAPLLAEAELNWSIATGVFPPISIGIVAEALPSGVLGQSEVTAWDSSGKPIAGIIYLSPDADGQGWYIDPTSGDNTAFTQQIVSTEFAAEPGSPAYGHYDLLTTLEHEVGHILGFYPGNPGYESHLEMVNGSQLFVGPGFTAQVAPGGELDPSVYPDAVMAATLAPGVLKYPDPLEMQVISTLWHTASPPSSQAAGDSGARP